MNKLKLLLIYMSVKRFAQIRLFYGTDMGSKYLVVLLATFQ